jgi:hypothetical protein
MTRGRAYFRKLEKDYAIEKLDPDALNDKPTTVPLKRGSAKSRVGGRLGHYDLTSLEPEETQSRIGQSEEFLKLPARHFPADENN